MTVNPAPADLAKEDSHFDLPIARGRLVSLGALPGRTRSRAISRSASWRSTA
jgi:predicted ATPase with chaperone activity